MKYIVSIDQSTQGTKALLFDQSGLIIGRTDVAHRQIISDIGWVSHDMEEIYANMIQAVKQLLEKTQINSADIAGVGISNQRETSVIWDEKGRPLNYAIVWQCTRSSKICSMITREEAEEIRRITGIPLSPFYSASKIKWLIDNTIGVKEKIKKGKVYYGTVDTWMVFRLTNGEHYKTDYSNASRTQLFDITSLTWSETVCRMFDIDIENLAQVCDSNADYGETDFEGLLPRKVPIRAVVGDSHGALFGQGCFSKGMTKATYGTGSSIMMNIGRSPVISEGGIVTSLAWGLDGKVDYVMEGNVIYSGGVMLWLKDRMSIIRSVDEAELLANQANSNDTTVIVPAFTGLGAPYWDNKAKATVHGMTSTTGKAEFVKAALESIAYQINDVVEEMERTSRIKIKELRTDGGATKNKYLMQFQSNISEIDVRVSRFEELSGTGAAYIAGIKMGILDNKVFESIECETFSPQMKRAHREEKCNNWKVAVCAARLNHLQ